jgi:hypothetical protein
MAAVAALYHYTHVKNIVFRLIKKAGEKVMRKN